jgi:hypothetical protein
LAKVVGLDLALLPRREPLSNLVKLKIEEAISAMLGKISRIVDQEAVSHREVMNYVRSSVLFKDIEEVDSRAVDDLVGEYVSSRIRELENELKQKTEELALLKEEAS